MKDAIFIDYREVVALVEQEFDRNHRLYGERMQCGRGCSSCCSQMFRITIMDAAVISRAVKRMDTGARRALQGKARRYLEERDRLMAQRAQRHDAGQDREIPTTGLRLPCPALGDDGACGMYEARPVVCRKWGIPLFDPQHPDTLQACELNFPPGTAFEDAELDELVARQTEIAERWQRVKAQTNDRLRPERAAAAIAEAMVYDYDEMVEMGRAKPERMDG